MLLIPCGGFWAEPASLLLSLPGKESTIEDEAMRRGALIVTPWLLLASTTAVFRRLALRLGSKGGYFGGFLFYWLAWCLLLPLWVLGPRRLRDMFGVRGPQASRPTYSDLLLLAVPPIVGYSLAFPRALARANKKIVLASGALALVNATAEEVLWRGTYVAVFPNRLVLGYLYPTVGFALSHYAPQTVFPSRYPGGASSFVVSAGLFGLLWGRVAYRSGSVGWTVLSHALLDFSGLGARVYFEDSGSDGS
jgi:membrane protease YdiL (CAAX protease family)